MKRICVALDVEMTGSQAGSDEIIEVAAVKFRGDEVLETFAQLVKPRQALPLKITRLTGITAEMLESAPRFNAIGARFAAFVKNYPLVGHSIEFDLAMLRAQGMRFDQPIYDTFDLATLLLPQVPVYSQSALAEYLRLPNSDAHRALNDAQICRQIFLYLVGRLEQMDLHDLAEVKALMDKTDWSSRELVADILRDKSGAAWDTPLRQARRDLPIKVLPSETPLKPTGDTEPVDVAAVDDWFAPEGVLSGYFAAHKPGAIYEQRPQQRDMARAVLGAFNMGDQLLVEAGTGTGKSMAYLVPAALFARQRGERVVVSTNTINLQDQLFKKDIPDIQSMLDLARARALGNGSATEDDPDDDEPPVRAALLKGRSNYLCLRRYKSLLEDDSLQPHEARALLKARLWLPVTTTGDRAELLLVGPEQSAWGRMNVTLDTCTAQRCPFFRECYFFQARRRAEAAHLVVVNHALLLADLASPANVLPEYDHLIIDEAHNLEDVATDQLGFQIDRTGMLQFLDSLWQTGGAQSISGLLAEYRTHMEHSAATGEQRERADSIAEQMRPAVERARQHTVDCFERLLAVIAREATAGPHDPRLRLTPGVLRRPEWADVEHAWENLNLSLTEIGTGLGNFESLLIDLESADLLEYDELRLRVEWLRRYATEVRVQMGHIVFGNDEHVAWLSLDQFRSDVTLHAAPLSVAEILQSQLFAQKQTSILTSATLSINDTFDFISERLGLYEPETGLYDSPFDYEKQAVVFIPSDIPEPNQQGYQAYVEEALAALSQATGGRTLALFTSSSALRQAYHAIREPLEADEITVLAQGIDGSRRALLERFKEWPRTVLLGTSSFWEGVDVVGDALSVLVITKLPFNVPSDPVFAARSERFQDPFIEYSVPQSILRFKQGFGRLIRSKDDRGVVVVLDKRLLTKRYGQQFLQSLPNTSVRTGTLKQLAALAARFVGNGGDEGRAP
jgi:DNA polymerase-3 subunit epsilon/ATP-dependent DNA helicase DinG